MSRQIAVPKDYQESSIQLFTPFLEIPPNQSSDDQYYQMIKLFFRSILRLESYHQFWKKEEDSELFDSILIASLHRALKRAQLTEKQLESVIAWMMDPRFVMILALMQHWVTSETGRIQLNRLVHYRYDRDNHQRNLVDNSYIPGILSILQKRLVTNFAVNASFSGDIVGFFMVNNLQGAFRLFNLLRIKMTKLTALFQKLEGERNLSILDITQDFLTPLELPSEATLIKNSHKVMADLIIEELNDPAVRAINFIISAYEQQQDIDALLCKIPFSGVSDIIDNDPFWTKKFLREVLTALYFIVSPKELPETVYHELQITFSGVECDDFTRRLDRFKEDPFFKNLLLRFLELSNQESKKDFGLVLDELTETINSYRVSQNSFHRFKVASNDTMLQDIQSWAFDSLSPVVLTAISHQCLDLQNIAFCEENKTKWLLTMREEGEQELPVSDQLEASRITIPQEASVSFERSGIVDQTLEFEEQQRAWQESRDQHCFRKKTDLYRFANEHLNQGADKRLECISEAHDDAERAVLKKLSSEKQERKRLEQEQIRARAKSFREEGETAGFRAGVEAHKKIVRSRIKKIAFSVLAALGAGLLIYLSIQSFGALPAAIAISIGLKSFWIAGGVSIGVGVLGVIAEYGRDRGWFAKKSVQQTRVTQKKVLVLNNDDNSACSSGVANKKTESLKSTKSTDSQDSAIASGGISPPMSEKTPDFNTSIRGLAEVGLYGAHSRSNRVVADVGGGEFIVCRY